MTSTAVGMIFCWGMLSHTAACENVALVGMRSIPAYHLSHEASSPYVCPNERYACSLRGHNVFLDNFAVLS